MGNSRSKAKAGSGSKGKGGGEGSGGNRRSTNVDTGTAAGSVSSSPGGGAGASAADEDVGGVGKERQAENGGQVESGVLTGQLEEGKEEQVEPGGEGQGEHAENKGGQVEIGEEGQVEIGVEGQIVLGGQMEIGDERQGEHGEAEQPEKERQAEHGEERQAEIGETEQAEQGIDWDAKYTEEFSARPRDYEDPPLFWDAEDVDVPAETTVDTNGTAPPSSTPPPPPPPPEAFQSESPRQEQHLHHQVRLCKLCKWADFDGYGFNLHAEKDKPGQFIGVVDPSSPAETGGLKEGDRIIEVNGENIESQTHAAAIQRVKSGGDHTELLVVDKAADAYYKGLGVSLSGGMAGVVVISTQSTMGDVEVDHSEQIPEPVASFSTFMASEEPPSHDHSEQIPEPVASFSTFMASEEPPSYSFQVEKSEEAEVATTAETEVTHVGDVNLSTLPEPNVSLSDEESEVVTAVVAQQVESNPEPPREEETVANGHDVRKEEEEEKKEEEEEQVSVATEAVVQAVAVAAIDDVVTGEEKQEEEEMENEVEFNDYEQVEVKAAVPTFYAPPVDEDLGPVSYSINGGSEEPQPEPTPEPEPQQVEPEPQQVEPEPATIRTEPIPVRKAPEPEPEPASAVIRSTVTTTTTTGPAMGGDLNLLMSAAEMKERLKARKKQDPRLQKSSFEAKSKMFEKL